MSLSVQTVLNAFLRLTYTVSMAFPLSIKLVIKKEIVQL